MVVLDYIAERDAAYYMDIVNGTGMPKSSVYNMLNTLCNYNILRQTQQGQYVLGYKLVNLGYKALHNIDVRNIAEPILKELTLETDLSCYLAILNDDLEGVCLVFTEPKREDIDIIYKQRSVGSKISLHQSAVGKALVAWQSPEDIETIISDLDFKKTADNTITDPETYARELEAIRERGYAIDDRETSSIVIGVAAPIFDISGKIIAGISIGGFEDEIKRIGVEELAKKMLDAAARISKSMGA